MAQSEQMNLYYLQVQEEVNAQNRTYTALSNVLEVEHSTGEIGHRQHPLTLVPRAGPPFWLPAATARTLMGAMGIDRIGKNGPPVPAPEVERAAAGARAAASRSRRTGADGRRIAPPRPPARQASTYERGRRGAARAASCRRGRSGRLRRPEGPRGHGPSFRSPARRAREDPRRALREQLANDPALVELLRTATGEIRSRPTTTDVGALLGRRAVVLGLATAFACSRSEGLAGGGSVRPSPSRPT